METVYFCSVLCFIGVDDRLFLFGARVRVSRTSWLSVCVGTFADLAFCSSRVPGVVVCFMLTARPVSADGRLEGVPANVTRALETFFISMNGEWWRNSTNWMSTKTICQWHGVQCDSTRQAVVSLVLPRNNLTGFLPDIWLLFPALKTLDLNSNRLQGFVPAFTGLGALTRIDLSFNELDLDRTSPIFKASPMLEYLDLSSNPIRGIIPRLDHLVHLTHLRMRDCILAGRIQPSAFDKLTALQEIHFLDGSLHGSLPNFTYNFNLIYIQFGDNRLTGTIPPWTHLPNLDSVFLHNNQFSGHTSV